jgi:hypothetical protein
VQRNPKSIFHLVALLKVREEKKETTTKKNVVRDREVVEEAKPKSAEAKNETERRKKSHTTSMAVPKVGASRRPAIERSMFFSRLSGKYRAPFCPEN